MSGTTIGEVNINLRLSLAHFKQDTADGTRAASTATKQMAEEVGKNSHEAQASLALIGEEIGISIPRHLRSFVAELPGVGSALNAAFNSVAIIALLGLIVEVTGKVKEYWEALGKLSAEDQKRFEEATKNAKEELGYRTTLVKAEYDLAIAKADGIQKDKLRVEQAVALVGLNKDYIGQLQEQKAHLLELRDAQQALADKANVPPTINAVNPMLGFNMWDLAKGEAAKKQVEDINAKVDVFDKTLNLADAALQQAQADSINTGTAMNDHLAANAEKSAKQLDQLVEASSKLHRLLGVPMDLQINVSDVGDDIFKIGQMLEKLPQPQLPQYSGTKEAEDFYKIQTQTAAAIAASQQVYTATRTAAEQYAQEIEKLDELWLQGRIDQDTYNRAVGEAKAKYDSVSIAARQFGTDIMDTLKTGALWGSSWKDTLESLAIQLTELILKMTLLKSLQSTTSAGGGGFFSSLLGGLFGGGKASGGAVEPGQYYEWQEKGHEYFAPGVSGSVIPAGALSSGGPVQNFHMTVNGVTDVDSFRRSKDQIASQMFGMMSRATRRNG